MPVGSQAPAGPPCPQKSPTVSPQHQAGDRSLAKDRPASKAKIWVTGEARVTWKPLRQAADSCSPGPGSHCGHYPPRSLGFCFPGQCCHLLETKCWTNQLIFSWEKKPGTDRGEANYQGQWTVDTGLSTEQSPEGILPHLQAVPGPRTPRESPPRVGPAVRGLPSAHQVGKPAVFQCDLFTL